MKLNVKGLVFVGFAAAVFANAAAFAAGPTTGDKIVTSKSYVDSKYVGTGNISVTPNETTGKNEISVSGDLQAYTGDGDTTVNNHVITTNVPVKAIKVSGETSNLPIGEGGVVTIPAGVVPGNGTITVNQAGRAAQTFTVNQAGDATITLDNTEYSSFAGSTPGLVPDGTNADATKVLSGAGTWVDLGDNTAYTGSDGVTVTGHNITNSGVRAVTTGTTAGTISVNTNGTSADVAVNGLATVATTGAYSDLSGTPTIGSGTITVKQAGQNDQTFGVNDTSGTTINIAAPWTAPEANYCTAATPCALVNDGTNITWERIQQ